MIGHYENLWSDATSVCVCLSRLLNARTHALIFREIACAEVNVIPTAPCTGAADAILLLDASRSYSTW